MISLFLTLAAAHEPVLTPVPIRTVRVDKVGGWDIKRQPNLQCHAETTFAPNEGLIVWANPGMYNGITYVTKTLLTELGDGFPVVVEIEKQTYPDAHAWVMGGRSRAGLGRHAARHLVCGTAQRKVDENLYAEGP